MTQRVARPMKFAAFISIIISVAVMFAACAGPAGTPGADGADGAAGADGAQGQQGDPAPLPLTGRIGPVLLDSLNAGDDENEATEFVIDLVADGYFNGGEGPYEFKPTGTIPAGVTAEIDDDTNMLKLKLASAATPTEEAYMTGFTVMVSATDANDETAESSVTVKPNTAPQTADQVNASNGALQSPNDSYTIGTMAGELDDQDLSAEGTQGREQGVAECFMFNECEVSLFQDHGDFDIDVTSDADGVKFSWSAEDGKLTLTGLESTWDADDEAFDPVEVTVEAEDEDGLSFELTFMLNVNSPPTLSKLADGIATDVEFELGTSDNSLINQDGAAALFDDLEDTVVVATFASSNDSIITVDADNGTVVPVSRGSTTITVTGTTGMQGSNTGGLGQSAEIEYSITVK